MRALPEQAVGQGREQGGAEAPAAAGGGPEQQVQSGVVRPGRVVRGERVEVGAVDLPVAHRGVVEQSEAGQAAAVAVELVAQVPFGDGGRAGEFPERGHLGVVHPAGEQAEVGGEPDLAEPELPGGGGHRAPPRRFVDAGAPVHQPVHQPVHRPAHAPATGLGSSM